MVRAILCTMELNPMRQATHILRIQTDGRGLVEITRDVGAWAGDQNVSNGLLTLFCRHTSASLLIQENAAPEVRTDLENFFASIAPEDPSRYIHSDEGPDDMPAHLRAALTATKARTARNAEVKASSPGCVPFLSKYAPVSRKKKKPNTLAVKTRCHLDVKR